jgi:YD repeat-containing protein
MSTRNIVPRSNGEGKLGTSTIRWGEGHFNSVLKRGGYQTAVEFLNLPSIYSSFSLVRDGNGNVTSVRYYGPGAVLIGTATMAYNVSNNVTSVSDGTKTITFTYDGSGNITGGTVS